MRSIQIIHEGGICDGLEAEIIIMPWNLSGGEPDEFLFYLNRACTHVLKYARTNRYNLLGRLIYEYAEANIYVCDSKVFIPMCPV